MHNFIHILVHTLKDTLHLVPFLLVAFLIIEFVEHKISKKSREEITKQKPYTPVIGALLGLIPQCGFSVIATNLYITRIISLGTLIAIYLSTSDEMLPILLSHHTETKTIITILAIKFIVGLVAGLIIDFVLRNKKKEKQNFDICKNDNCGCEEKENVFLASLIHTLKTISFIFIITFLINIVFHFNKEDLLNKILLKGTIFAPFISSLIGLIPNCGSSVILTELYLKDALTLGGAIGGLLTNSGLALLVLFKNNKNLKENLKIVTLIYSIGVIVGILIELITRII